MTAFHLRRSLLVYEIGLAFGVGLAISGILVFAPSAARACGGFFCQTFPIDQTAEEIIFRQDGNQVTAIVQIKYTGAAEKFSWVVPVPGVPTFALASDLLFSSLEMRSRPQFVLDVTGEPCPSDFRFLGGIPSLAPSAAEDSAGGVQVIEEIAVGPFEIQVVRSEDPTALAKWLTDNGYDLSDRGEELIAPYVQDGMNFVGVQLQKDKTSGDIQPLKMVYQSTHPVIPIRLTAIATQPNLGVLVWVLGPGRAVPLNYLHVTPNYGKLNWFNGTFAAYASYQQLITAAMNEAGGQGFATDYAGPSDTIVAQLPGVAVLRAELDRLKGIADAATAIAALTNGSVFQPASAQLQPIFARALPLPAEESTFVYQDESELQRVFDAATLTAARQTIFSELETTIINPYADGLAIFDGNPTMTRLYTTLSAEEMTLDPSFSFNAGLPGQQLDRHAALAVSCVADVTNWTLTLGAGTGREGEIIARGTGPVPFSVPTPLLAQPNVKSAVRLSESGPGEMVTDNALPTVDVGEVVAPAPCGNGAVCGLTPVALLLTSLIATRGRRVR